MGENLAVKQLLEFHSIRRVIYQYSRALDRCDLDLLKDVYWPDATHEHGSFNGNAHEFADYAVPAIRKKFLRTLHSIANIHVDVQGDFADSESYVTAYHMISGDPEVVRSIFGEEYPDRHKNSGAATIDFIYLGRYIDRFECRPGEWRIKRRVLTWAMRRIVEAILFLLRGGLPWRMGEMPA